MLFVNHPMFRLLWIVATLFIMFYALNTMTNYTAAVRFGWLIVITTPTVGFAHPGRGKAGRNVVGGRSDYPGELGQCRG